MKFNNSKFVQKPNNDKNVFVEYFNLEFGIDAGLNGVSKFKSEGFEFIGFYLNGNEIETMYWSVRGYSYLYAIKQPFEGEVLISMTKENPNPLKKVDI